MKLFLAGGPSELTEHDADVLNALLVKISGNLPPETLGNADTMTAVMIGIRDTYLHENSPQARAEEQTRKMGGDGRDQVVASAPVVTHKLIKGANGTTWEVKADCCRSNQEAFDLITEGDGLFRARYGHDGKATPPDAPTPKVAPAQSPELAPV